MELESASPPTQGLASRERDDQQQGKPEQAGSTDSTEHEQQVENEQQAEDQSPEMAACEDVMKSLQDTVSQRYTDLVDQSSNDIQELVQPLQDFIQKLNEEVTTKLNELMTMRASNETLTEKLSSMHAHFVNVANKASSILLAEDEGSAYGSSDEHGDQPSQAAPALLTDMQEA